MNNKNNFKDYVNVGVCALIMFGFFFSMFFTSNGGYSENEKRDLATFPKISEMSFQDILKGTYFAKIDEFYKDNFVNRESFLALSDSIDGLKGFESDVKMTVVSNQQVQGTSNTPSDDSEEDSNVNVEQVGTLLSIGDFVCETFGGNDAVAKDYAKTIKNFGDTLPNSNVYNMVIPTQVEFGLPKKYANLSVPQKPTLDLISKNLGKNVTSVDAYSNIKKHKDEYVYFRSDHHWTGLGAYYAYEAYAKSAGLEPFDLKDFDSKKIEGFLGTLYASSKESKLADNPDYVEYYNVGADLKTTIYQDSALTNTIEVTPYADYATGANSYSVYLHGDNPLTVIENPELKSGKKAVVIKESYGNAFAPYLSANYDEVYIVDIRKFKSNLKDLITENNIDDVVFINNAFATCSQARVDEIKSLLK